MPKRAAAISKRDAIVDATLRLLRTAGLGGASINRAIEASGAPKGSLYHYFPGGKVELVSAALARFAEEFSGFVAAHFGGPGSFEARWTALTRAMAAGLHKSRYKLGCPVAATLLDLEGEDTEQAEALRGVARAALDAWVAAIAAGLPELAPARRQRFAEMLVMSLEGALILARATRDGAALDRAREVGLVAYRALA